MIMVSRKMHQRQNAGDVTKLRKGGLYANEQRQDSKTANENADSQIVTF